MFRVISADAGKSLLGFLQKHLSLSGRAIKKIIDNGGVRINGRIERFATHRVTSQDEIEIDKDKWITPQTVKLKILYEDEDLLVFDNPSGLTSSYKDLRPFFSQKIFLVHRLDKGTSGAMILAKHSIMQREMEKLFKKREVKKVYLAIIKGKMRQKKGKIESYLIPKEKRKGQKIWESTKTKEGLYACTYYQCLRTSGGFSLLKLIPITGRMHQLRVQLSEMGHPICGDPQYGGAKSLYREVDRLFLHSYQITFVHPFSQKRIRITAPLPNLLPRSAIDYKKSVWRM